MSDSGQIRVILRWIQIKDNKEAMWDDEGEFRFRSRITTNGESHELTFPEQGYWSISDHPRRNKVDKIDKVLYEGGFGDNLVVELFGEELDDFTANDHLEDYRREFDMEKRIAMYRRFQEILHAEQPYTFLWKSRTATAFSRRFRGVNWYPGGTEVREWWVQAADRAY